MKQFKRLRFLLRCMSLFLVEERMKKAKALAPKYHTELLKP